MLRFPLVVAYLSSIALVSPCAGHAAPKSKGRRAPEITLAQFVEKLKAEGQDTQSHPILVKLLGFPADSTRRGVQAAAAESTDGRERGAYVVFGKAASSGESEPIGLNLTTALEVNRRSEGHLYHAALDGSLIKAVRIDGERDEKGNSVRGAGKRAELDVQANEVQDRFQREVLDFWLKGKGRKKGRGNTAP